MLLQWTHGEGKCKTCPCVYWSTTPWRYTGGLKGYLHTSYTCYWVEVSLVSFPTRFTPQYPWNRMLTCRRQRACFMCWIFYVLTDHGYIEHKITYKKTHASCRIKIETIVVRKSHLSHQKKYILSLVVMMMTYRLFAEHVLHVGFDTVITV